MPLFRKKPVVIEAVQWTGDNMHEVAALFDEWKGYRWGKEINELIIITLEGDITAKKLDFIIKGINGEFYPCRPDIFEKTHEPI